MKIANVFLIALMIVVPFAEAHDISLVGTRPSWMSYKMEKELLNGNTMIADQSVEISDNIQPGSWMFSPNWCTLNYVFKNKNSGRVAIGTAGHCTSVGQDVKIVTSIESGEYLLLKSIKIGSTIFSTGSGGVGNDFALILIDEDKENMVESSIKTIDGPCGYSTDSISGKQVVHFGHGLVIGTGGTFRFGLGSVTLSQPNSIIWQGVAIGGDSGSPVRLSLAQSDSLSLTNENAAAVGIQTHVTSAYGVPAGTVKGTSIKKILEFIPEWDIVSSRNCR